MLLCGLLAALPIVLGAFSYPEATRPDPLEDEDGCEHYTGTSSGNDPSVTFDVVLCPHEDGTEGKVTGKVQWSSLLSGWNVRKIEGNWAGAGLAMKDLEIVEERPEPGFRFCMIENYDLKKQADGSLTGTYDAEDCDDHATVELKPKARPAGATGGDPTALPDRQGEDPKTPETDAAEPGPESGRSKKSKDANTAKEPKRQGGGCGCDVGLLAGLLVPLGARRRRRRTN